MKKTAVLVSILVLVVVAGYGANLFRRSQFLKTCQNFIIHERQFCLLVAKTPQQRQEGLMGVKTLSERGGVLFVFDEPGIYPFWNKDTLVDLDVIWLRRGKIVAIKRLPKIGKEPIIVNPQLSAERVIELKAGTAQSLHMKVGEKIKGLYETKQ